MPWISSTSGLIRQVSLSRETLICVLDSAHDCLESCNETAWDDGSRHPAECDDRSAERDDHPAERDNLRTPYVVCEVPSIGVEATSCGARCVGRARRRGLSRSAGWPRAGREK